MRSPSAINAVSYLGRGKLNEERSLATGGFETLMAEQFARAKSTVESRRHEVGRIAEALLAQGTLSAEAVRDLMDHQPDLKLVEATEKRAG